MKLEYLKLTDPNDLNQELVWYYLIVYEGYTADRCRNTPLKQLRENIHYFESQRRKNKEFAIVVATDNQISNTFNYFTKEKKFKYISKSAVEVPKRYTNGVRLPYRVVVYSESLLVAYLQSPLQNCVEFLQKSLFPAVDSAVTLFVPPNLTPFFELRNKVLFKLSASWPLSEISKYLTPTLGQVSFETSPDKAPEETENTEDVPVKDKTLQQKDAKDDESDEISGLTNQLEQAFTDSSMVDPAKTEPSTTQPNVSQGLPPATTTSSQSTSTAPSSSGIPLFSAVSNAVSQAVSQAIKPKTNNFMPTYTNSVGSTTTIPSLLQTQPVGLSNTAVDNTVYLSQLGYPGYKGAYQVPLKNLWSPDSDDGHNIDYIVEILRFCKASKQYRDDRNLILAFLGQNGAMSRISNLSDEQLSDLEVFIKWLNKYNKMDGNYYRTKFKKLQQGSKSFRTFLYDVESCYRKAHEKNKDANLSKNDKQQIVNGFIRGLKDPRIKLALIQLPDSQKIIDHNSDNDIVSHAEQLKLTFADIYRDEDNIGELATQQQKFHTTNAVITDTVTESIKQLEDKFNKELTLLAEANKKLESKFKKESESAPNPCKNPNEVAEYREQHRPRPKFQGYCYGCGRWGHHIQECRASAKYARGSAQRNENMDRRFGRYNQRGRGNWNNRGGHFNNQGGNRNENRETWDTSKMSWNNQGNQNSQGGWNHNQGNQNNQRGSWNNNYGNRGGYRGGYQGGYRNNGRNEHSSCPAIDQNEVSRILAQYPGN